MNAGAVLLSESSNSVLPGLPLLAGSFTLGRSPTCVYVVDHTSISRRHADIVLIDGALQVRDLGSSNGTFLDGRRIHESVITPGQSLRFGNISFRFLSWTADPQWIGSEEETDKSDYFEEPTGPDKALLTAAQARIFNHVLRGSDEKEIAKRFHLSPHTVHNHLKAIYKVFRVHSRAELMAIFIEKNGTIPLFEII